MQLASQKSLAAALVVSWGLFIAAAVLLVAWQGPVDGPAVPTLDAAAAPGPKSLNSELLSAANAALASTPGNEPQHNAADQSFQLTVNVIAFKRPKSLTRLLKSLLTADYQGDSVNMHIFVDSAGVPDPTVMDIVEKLVWPHGTKRISLRNAQAGLVNNIVESWYPLTDNEYVMFAEDDIELSPFWYVYAKQMMVKYRLRPDRDPNLFGISLYTPRELETLHPHLREGMFHPYPMLNVEDTPFLHQMPCSWGAIYFPEHWRAFRRFVAIRDTIRDMELENSYITGWTGSWIKWFYEMIYLKGWYMIYPNYPDEMSLSTNHCEPGVHVSGTDSTQPKYLFTVPLMVDQFTPPPLLPIEQLPVVDMMKLRSEREELIRRGRTTLLGGLNVLKCKCGVDCGRLIAEALDMPWNPAAAKFHTPASSECTSYTVHSTQVIGDPAPRVVYYSGPSTRGKIRLIVLGAIGGICLMVPIVWHLVVCLFRGNHVHKW